MASTKGYILKIPRGLLNITGRDHKHSLKRFKTHTAAAGRRLQRAGTAPDRCFLLVFDNLPTTTR